MIAGARVVWKNRSDRSELIDPDHRITFALTNLIQSTSAVVDLLTGELVEAGGFCPNGARETQLGADDEVGGAQNPLEPLGFTGKEADEEVGLTYFGERYLVQRIGRWATPDPLSIHAAGGGEAVNAYHYVSGNLLQTRDPLALWPDLAQVKSPLITAGRHVVAVGIGTADALTDGRVSETLMKVDGARFESIMADSSVQKTYAAAHPATAVVETTVGAVGTVLGGAALVTAGGAATPVAAPAAVGGAALATYGARQMTKTAEQLQKIQNFSKGGGSDQPKEAPKTLRAAENPGTEVSGPRNSRT